MQSKVEVVGGWPSRQTSAASHVEQAEKRLFSCHRFVSQGTALATHRVGSGLQKFENLPSSPTFRFCRAHSTGGTTPVPQGDSGTVPSSSDDTRANPVVDTDLNAVTSYIVGMAQKSLQKGETATPTSKLEELRTREGRLWDCLDTVEFVLDVEEIFDVTVPDETADNFETLQEIAEFVVAARAKAQKTMKDQ